jgi:hypothetical protein
MCVLDMLGFRVKRGMASDECFDQIVSFLKTCDFSSRLENLFSKFFLFDGEAPGILELFQELDVFLFTKSFVINSPISHLQILTTFYKEWSSDMGNVVMSGHILPAASDQESRLFVRSFRAMGKEQAVG